MLSLGCLYPSVFGLSCKTLFSVLHSRCIFFGYPILGGVSHLRFPDTFCIREICITFALAFHMNDSLSAAILLAPTSLIFSFNLSFVLSCVTVSLRDILRDKPFLPFNRVSYPLIRLNPCYFNAFRDFLP